MTRRVFAHCFSMCTPRPTRWRSRRRHRPRPERACWCADRSPRAFTWSRIRPACHRAGTRSAIAPSSPRRLRHNPRRWTGDIMRGIGLFEFGGPEVLRVVDLPETHAAAGEVRIRVHASTVNPTDTYLRKGARAESLRTVPPPYIPGMDVAGIIDEIGAGTATDLALGDAVMAMVVNHGSHGGYRESIVLPADCVVRAPAGASLIEAATLP